MSADFWRVDDDSFFLYIDAEHKTELRNIKRSKPHWSVVATYSKNGGIGEWVKNTRNKKKIASEAS